MTQEEKWLAKYDEVVAFIKTNKRNPSKHSDEDEHAEDVRIYGNTETRNYGTKESRKALREDLRIN